MLKTFVAVWLAAGMVLVGAYASSPVQRRFRQARAEELLQAAHRARGRAAELSGCPDRTPAKQAEATAQWHKVHHAAEAALATFPDAKGLDALWARVLLAEARAQTGQADLALQDLLDLEDQAAKIGDANISEAVQATMAKTTQQLALMLRKESSDDSTWITHSERACLYYQELLKNARNEAARDAYRKNLACVMRFRYGTGDESNCWSMPGVPTPDCPKKLRRIQREQQGGGGGGGNQFKPPPSDMDDRWRREAVEKTQQRKDKGK